MAKKTNTKKSTKSNKTSARAPKASTKSDTANRKACKAVASKHRTKADVASALDLIADVAGQSPWDVSELSLQEAQATLADVRFDFLFANRKVLIEFPTKITLVVRLGEFVCTLFPSGRVEHEGKFYRSPSQAMGRITGMKGSVAWARFVYEKEDGLFYPIDQLRPKSNRTGVSEPAAANEYEEE